MIFGWWLWKEHFEVICEQLRTVSNLLKFAVQPMYVHTGQDHSGIPFDTINSHLCACMCCIANFQQIYFTLRNNVVEYLEVLHELGTLPEQGLHHFHPGNYVLLPQSHRYTILLNTNNSIQQHWLQFPSHNVVLRNKRALTPARGFGLKAINSNTCGPFGVLAWGYNVSWTLQRSRLCR